jgi:hypothetical protein
MRLACRAGNLSADALAEVIRDTLNGTDSHQNAGRSWEVSLGTRAVTAGTALEAARIAGAEWNEETGDRYYQPDPNEHYEVRPAYSQSSWQIVHT